MKRILKTLLLLVLPFSLALGQQQIRKLPGIINHPSFNVIAPFISADGNSMLFMADGGEDGAFVVFYASREGGDWIQPVAMPKWSSGGLNYAKGYALSADGKQLFITSAKSPIIGGFDIFVSNLKGATWSNPENMGVPINSTANEASPSITPDGKALYFMRCDRINPGKADGCTIFRALKKPNGKWGEPEALPASINTGNSQSPRIMADGETLIFSSDKIPGNKGGMDLYVTRFVNGSWSAPESLNFVNSEKDDQFVSAAALGRYLLKETIGTRGRSEIVEVLIPGHLRPKGLMKIEGKVLNESGAAVPAYISLTDLTSEKRVYSGRPLSDGSYFFYVPEGSRYEVSFDPEASEFSYYARIYDLTSSEKFLARERLNVTLKQPKTGDRIPIDLVSFVLDSKELTFEGREELDRLVRLIKAYPASKFEIRLPAPRNVQTVSLLDSTSDSTSAAPDSTAVGMVQPPEMTQTQERGETIIQYLIARGAKPEQVSYAITAEEEMLSVIMN